MIDPQDLSGKLAQLDTLLSQKLGLRRGPLDRRAARAGRRLPRAVRRDITYLGQAGRLAGHPVLSARFAPHEVAAAHARAVARLESIDVADRRKGALLSFLAVVSVNLFVLILLVLGLLRWRGLV
ncbi:hypothetical protein [Mesobacterium pallidum]|uniref:hypothetical protein n=1 Tax=Mesobacterium pallidum TaxID=2872037 RepID=UPI001EE1826F|nr:hypothetical protein [Mesobacterium pallidum]